MTEEPVTNRNFARLCRCCVSEYDLMYDIFYGTCSSAQTYYEVIMECAPIQLYRDDGLPCLVCHKCVLILESFVAFRKKCIESDSILRRMSENISPDEQEALDDEESNDVGDTNRRETEFDGPENPATEIRPELILCNEIKVENTSVDEYRSDANPQTELDRRFIENFFDVKEEFVDDYRVESEKSYAEKKAYVHSCDRCEKSFRFKSFLDRHRRIHMDVKPYACDECAKTFSTKSNLDRHRNTHAAATSYACDECAKSFNCQSYLNKHRKMHSGEKPYACDTCGKSFVDKAVLGTHRKIHAVDKPYACDACGKSFSRKDYFNKHRQTHTDERPFSCDTCAKSFKGKWHLGQHRKIHTGERPYACDRCDKSFAWKSLFNRHRKTHDAGEKP